VNSAKAYALIAGAAFISLAVFIQAIIPATLKETRGTAVTRTVRTPLGELAEVKGDARPYTPLLARGRAIYIREGCWYCHSMYVRPVAGEERRWGALSQAGEYAYDTPHTFGTRRIGPDLTRDGGKYGDDWHRAHFFDPRLVVPDSIMPGFAWLFKKNLQKPVEDKQPDEGKQLDHAHVLPAESEFVPNEDGEAVMAFVQSLGMNRGKWRDDFPYQIAASGSASFRTEASVEHGKEVFKQRCEGCHGEKGDGKGQAAKFFVRAKPRDFTSGTFKFRTTPSGSLPLDSDIYRTITAGVRGTAMPPWFTLPEEERWDLVHYIKTFSREFKDSAPEPPVYVPAAAKPNAEMLAQGRELYDKFQCWQCHGREGRGDGPSAATLTDDWGDRILPTDFTAGVFKVVPRPEDIFRTFMTGLNGTPMPSYKDFLPSEDAAWALSYFVLGFSADE
jgi:cytochrome c oxidase cbb3-type subunit 2